MVCRDSGGFSGPHAVLNTSQREPLVFFKPTSGRQVKMSRRFVAIWFVSLMTDWMQRKHTVLKGSAFALSLAEKGRRVVKAVSTEARSRGVYPEMVVADCKALVPELEVLDFDAEQPQKLLHA